MKIKIRSNDDQLIIYREKTGVVLYAIFLAICCIAFGVTFSYLGKDDLFPQIFGGVFAIVGALIFFGLPKYNRTMKDEGGAVLLSANRERLSIAPLLNMSQITYSWQDISRIILTKKLIIKKPGERSYTRNVIIVNYRRGGSISNVGLIDRSRNQIWASPKGYNISVVDFPRKEMETIKKALISFSSNNTEVSSYGRVYFNYSEDTERFLP